TVYDTQAATAAFDSSGALISTTLGSINNNGTSIKLDLGIGYNGITSFNGPSPLGSSKADGLQGGDLLGYDINTNGEVIATFSNGQQSSVGKIALFHFQNDKGLERINGSRFEESANSGQPLFFKNADGENILGATLQNFKLESSNVKFEVGLTELIVFQRSYGANSKCITTADEMMQKALNMHK
ncbi:flagellar hook-basal body protein, partial [Epsilonproteobacteria bacterium SCGC AD-308-O04]